MLRYSPRGTAVFDEINGTTGWWDHADYLLAAIYDTLRAGNWQRSGGQGDYPVPYPRPGAESGSAPAVEGESHFGAEPVTPDEFNQWWEETG